MKKCIYLVLITLILFFHNLLFAANHYIRAGANGNGDGSDWTNARIELPSTLIRGDTYYIADGIYDPYIFDDQESGSTYIYIKKATGSDHGTDTGWQDSYGDGQAIFNTAGSGYIWTINRNYYKISGASYLDQSDPSTYGFYLYRTNCTRCNYDGGDTSHILGMLGSDYVTLEYTAITNCGDSCIIPQYGIRAFETGDPQTNVTIRKCYFEKSSTNLFMMNCNNWLIEYCYFHDNWSYSPYSRTHGQHISPGNGHTGDADQACYNIEFRYNILNESEVYGIGFHNANGNYNWNVHGNIAIGGNVNIYGVFGNADTNYSNVVSNSSFHNNTFVDIKGNWEVGIVGLGNSGNGCTVYNNLVYGVNDPIINGGGTFSHDYNAFFGCTGTIPFEPNRQIGSSDPFVMYSSHNYHLNEGTNSGDNTIGNIFKIDMDGITRGNDGLWDRGAYEYDGGSKLSAPQNLEIVEVN